MTDTSLLEIDETVKKVDWERIIRDEFRKSTNSPDQTERFLAIEVLKIPQLNEFCFVIAPKIAEKLVRNPNFPSGIDIRIWSVKHPSHVSILAVDKQNKEVYLVDAAGLLNTNKSDDSPLGVTRLTGKSRHHLYGNPEVEQYISPPLRSNSPDLGKIQSEEEMESQRLTSFSQLF